MVWKFIVDALDKLEEMGDLCRVGWAKLFVEFNDDPEANQHIFFILKLQQLESEGQNILGIWLEEVICRQPLDHLQHQLPDLLDVELCYEMGCSLLMVIKYL